MREVLGFSTAGGGKPLKSETVALETSEKMGDSDLEFCIKPSSIPGYLDLTPEQARRLIRTEPLTDYYDVEEEPFARGKYAAVRRCRHKSSGRHFAAKFLRKRRRSADLRPEIVHEVAVLESCRRSPRVVRLHEVYESTHEMVLLLELACGGELQMLLDKDEVPSEHVVLRLMRQILDGLIHLHSINVAHLDIKPQNLVLTGKFPDCDVKLCDFGISRYLSEGVDVREILGTPDYVAPEVLNYEPISLATDMWSVGVLLYVLLTGCSPFGGDTKQETFCNITQCRLDFPEDIFEEISDEAKDLMRKLMVKNPSKRLTAPECLQHPWFTSLRPSSSLTSPSSLNPHHIGATTPRTPTLSKRPAPTMEHSEDRSLDSTDESDAEDTETALNSKQNAEFDPCLVLKVEKVSSNAKKIPEPCSLLVQNGEIVVPHSKQDCDESLCVTEIGVNSIQDAESVVNTEINRHLDKNTSKTSLNSSEDAEFGQNCHEVSDDPPSVSAIASNPLQAGSSSAEIDPSQDSDHHEDRSSTTSSCCFDHDEKSSTISSSSTLTAESCSDRGSVVGGSDLGCENLSAGLGSIFAGNTSAGAACAGMRPAETTFAGSVSALAACAGKIPAGTTSSGKTHAGTTSSETISAGMTTKGLSGERKRSFMRNMESLVQKLNYTDAEGPPHGKSRENLDTLNNNLGENGKNINRLVNITLGDADLDKFLGSASKNASQDSSKMCSASTPSSRGNKCANSEEVLSSNNASYRLGSKLDASLSRSTTSDINQDLSDCSSSDDSCSRRIDQYSSDSSDESSSRRRNQYSSGDSSLQRGSRLFQESSSSSSDDLRSCSSSTSGYNSSNDVKKGSMFAGNTSAGPGMISAETTFSGSASNEDASSRSMLKDSWYKDQKTSSRLRHVDGFRSLARASGMQTMPSFLHYKLDCGYNFVTHGYESGDESVFKFRRVFILDDSDDRFSPPPSINGSLSSDNSISDSNSDTISEMSIDSGSDRSSIISLDDSLDFVYGKGLTHARHYSTSCYNVWEAVKSQGTSSSARVCPRECHGSFARALSKFTETTELKDGSYKEGAFHRQRKSLTIFNGYNTTTTSRTIFNSHSTSRTSTTTSTPINKKCIGLELMREHNGNVVVIREVKAVHGSKFPRCSEVKCESVQSRIRRLQVQNGIRTELEKERYNVF